MKNIQNLNSNFFGISAYESLNEKLIPMENRILGNK